jgi:hypothetical protein
MDIRYLKELIRDLDDDVEVRLMNQSNYPFEYSVVGGVTFDDIIDFQVVLNDPDEPVDLFEPASGNDAGFFARGPYCGAGIFYLCEGDQLGYGTKDAWSAEEERYGR